MFFQAMLLVGYLYAHLFAQRLGAWHLLLLLLPLINLPLGVPPAFPRDASSHPACRPVGQFRPALRGPLHHRGGGAIMADAPPWDSGTSLTLYMPPLMPDPSWPSSGTPFWRSHSLGSRPKVLCGPSAMSLCHLGGSRLA